MANSRHIENKWVVMRQGRRGKARVTVIASSEEEARGLTLGYNRSAPRGTIYWTEFRDSGGNTRSGLSELTLVRMLERNQEDENKYLLIRAKWRLRRAV